jgi:hypothetical protein
MLLVPPFHVIIIVDSSSFVKDQLANFGLFFLENIMNTKICSKCNTEKDFKDFAKDNSRKDGLMYVCKLCRKNQNKKYRQENKEKVMAYSEKYNKENKEKIRACKEKYRLANKDKLSKQKKLYKILNREKINQRRNQSRSCNVQQRIKHSLRARLWSAIRGNNKSLSTIELLGCDIEYLIKYIEDLFLESMSWDNYGEWHIDHIKPCSSFDLSNVEQQKVCFNYKNLQPLWAEDNLRKGAKIIDN